MITIIIIIIIIIITPSLLNWAAKSMQVSSGYKL